MSNIDIEDKINNSIALLPGSRKSEILLMGDQMIKAARELKKTNTGLEFFMPLSDESHLKLFKENMDGLVSVSINDSQEVLRKSQMSIITSGTATLESILSFTPCITLYKTNWLSYLIIKPLLKIDFFSLPNLISGKEILPELLQSEVTIEKIISSVNSIQKNGFNFYKDEFIKIRENLRGGGAEKASQEILKLLN